MYFKGSLLEIIFSYLLINSAKIMHNEVETVLEENLFDFRSLEQQTFIFVCSKVFCFCYGQLGHCIHNCPLYLTLLSSDIEAPVGLKWQPVEKVVPNLKSPV